MTATPLYSSAVSPLCLLKEKVMYYKVIKFLDKEVLLVILVMFIVVVLTDLTLDNNAPISYTRTWIYDRTTNTTIADITGNCTSIVYSTGIHVDCVTTTKNTTYRFDNDANTGYLLQTILESELPNYGKSTYVPERNYLSAYVATPTDLGYE